MSGTIQVGPPVNNCDTKLFPLKSLGTIFFNAIKRSDPNQILSVDSTGEEVTYGKFLKLSIELAKKFKEFGIEKGDVITIVSHNHWRYTLAIVSTFYIGAKVNLLNPDYTPAELKHLLTISQPVLILCTKTTKVNLLKLQSEGLISDKTLLEFEDFDKLLLANESDDGFEIVDLDPKGDVGAILTSSGTTGLPKCVQLTHFNLRSAFMFLNNSQFGSFSQTAPTLSYLPFFHCFGFLVILSSILHGTTSIIMQKFSPDKFLKAIQDYKVDQLFTVPPIILFLSRSPLVSKYDISSVKDVVCGAAPVSKDLEELISEKLKLKSIRQVYGMTEVSGAATIIYRNHNKKYGSAGKVVSSHQIKVSDVKTGKALPAYEPGELRIKGDAVMKGYLGNDEETGNAFDEDGFLKSGDLGYFDDQGYFFIVDRLKEIIKYKGFQVPPAEIERTLITHPAVKDVGVVGIPDEKAGEVPVAFVVKQGDKKVTEQELIDFVAENLSTQKHLYGGVRFIDEIPKNSSGKILRTKLKTFV